MTNRWPASALTRWNCPGRAPTYRAWKSGNRQRMMRRRSARPALRKLDDAQGSAGLRPAATINRLIAETWDESQRHRRNACPWRRNRTLLAAGRVRRRPRSIDPSTSAELWVALRVALTVTCAPLPRADAGRRPSGLVRRVWLSEEFFAQMTTRKATCPSSGRGSRPLAAYRNCIERATRPPTSAARSLWAQRWTRQATPAQSGTNPDAGERHRLASAGTPDATHRLSASAYRTSLAGEGPIRPCPSSGL